MRILRATSVGSSVLHMSPHNLATVFVKFVSDYRQHRDKFRHQFNNHHWNLQMYGVAVEQAASDEGTTF